MAARKSREERKQEKELEEARKAGQIAPLTDENGKDISPHIPQYISSTPWYIKQGDGPTLSHQRVQDTEKPRTDLNSWYHRGPKKGPVAKKFRKGACTNCGAMGHAAKFCLERPRKVGAKHKAVDLAADDAPVPELNLDYDGARDRWNGYDPKDYQHVIDKYNRMEEERRKIIKEKAQEEAKEKVVEEKIAPKTAEVELPEGASSAVRKFLTDDYEDEDEEADADVVLKGDEDQVGMKVNGKTRTTIRNLRIREDTAKYLLNLDPESAYYDPKTRSMRGNPLPFKDPSQLEFAGENFTRHTGFAEDFSRLQSYAFDANEKGQPVHMQAAPSQSELLHRDFSEKKRMLQEQQQKKILAQYGGEEHLKAPAKALLLGQTESYVEYSQDGKLVSGGETTILSKWQEDHYPGNHESVWGSFWFNGKWGYACCCQLEKNAYCVGEAGKEAHRKSQARKLENQAQQKQANNSSAITQEDDSSSRREKYSKKEQRKDAEQEEREKQDRLKKALRAEEERLSKPTHHDERNLKFNSFTSCEVTDEEMEAYRIKRTRAEDPMAEYIEASRKKQKTKK